jgi:PAS domain S-box-containing protein
MKILNQNTLYELSLIIGSSLDLDKNCIEFLRVLMTIKRFNSSCIYLKDKYSSYHKFHLAYANPKNKYLEKAISISYPIFSLLGNNKSVCIDYTDNNYQTILTENKARKGSYLIFNLNNIGILKLHSTLKKNEFTESERFYLDELMQNFSISLENCITHKGIKQEVISISKFAEENPDPIFRFSTSATILMFNNKAADGIIHFLDKTPSVKIKFLSAIREVYRIGLPDVVELEIKDTSFLCNVVPLIPEEYINVYLTDITAIKKANKAVKTSEEKYKSIIENMRLGLIEVDKNDKITKVYSGYKMLTGYKEEELLGKSLTKTLLPKKFQQIMLDQNKERKKGESGVYEVQIKHKNGDLIWVLISGSPLYDENDKFLGSIGIHLNISESKKMQEDLKLAKDKAEYSSQAKEQFLANMSHEIRTPINGIDGMAKLLEKTSLTKTQKEFVSAIRISSDNLLVIINDILDSSKIEAGKLTIEKIGFNLKEILSQTIKSIYHKAEEKRIILESNIDNDIAEILIGDPTRIGQIIINLLNNAIKFTFKGSVRLNCHLINKTKKSNTIKFEIIDTGIGIEEDKLLKIFDSFSQEDCSTTRKFGGTGLGLSISKQLVQIFNSNLKVRSVKGKGSTFYFTVKFPIGSSNDLVEKDYSLIHTDVLKNKRILVVEDNQINQFLVISLLKKWKTILDTAENGKVAIEKLNTRNYDIILMDIQMPIMSGIEATSIIRNKLKLTTPIIALTAKAIKGDDKEFLNAGMNDYISKPFSEHELVNKISKLINYESKII